MNSYQCIGNLTREPEIKNTNSGQTVCEFGIAVNDRDKTIFWDCTAWNKTAEICKSHLHKGSKIGITASITQEEWNDRSTGQKRTKKKLTILNFTFCDSKQSQGNQQAPQYHQPQGQSQYQPPAQPQYQKHPTQYQPPQQPSQAPQPQGRK